MPGNAMTKTSFLPHDLLWLSGADAVIADNGTPDWVEEALSRMPVAVVRRAVCDDVARVPIGLRGPTRAHRHAATVPVVCIRKSMAPEDLIDAQHWLGSQRRSGIAPVQALEELRARWNQYELDSQPLIWGPTGSVGFELATGMPVARPDSDLDLILRVPSPLPKAAAGALLHALEGLPARVDVQMETPLGCVVLREYAQGNAPRILLRTSRGPRLVRNPWSLEQGENA